MKRKTMILLIVVILAFIGWGIRVYFVNDGIAKKYEIKTYKAGEIVPFDKATFQVNNVQYGKAENNNGYKSIPVSIDMEVKNTSDKNVSLINIIETKLTYGGNYLQTNEGNFDAEELQDLPPNSTVNFTLLYHVPLQYKGKKGKLYIDQSFYRKQVDAKYKKGKRYGISIAL
ncbi:DUF4352 domain-containing protein [Bacillus sp. APMAM]|uniref:DUF4352 domain-containing protein n=1 Tax=Margalitia sp. FSL K6-0131 TaxID=2954604 RepID=UPI000F86DDA8|nr:DUF4352 domain-containing protein [Bacillus sp. APMAM]RTZ54909.1 DUF4352 domain-containing protein [Bacillus sp. SAJ1]